MPAPNYSKFKFGEGTGLDLRPLGGMQSQGVDVQPAGAITTVQPDF